MFQNLIRMIYFLDGWKIDLDLSILVLIVWRGILQVF